MNYSLDATNMDYKFWIPIVISICASIGALIWNYWQQKSIEKLKRENEKENLIHRIQFEKEFAIYNDLWGKLVDLRNMTVSLRPQLEFAELGQTEEERIQERLRKLYDAWNACVISFDTNKPFYPKEVYDQIEKAIRISEREAIEYRHGDSKDKEYWESAEKNIKEIVGSMDKACEIIRQRIGLIRIRE